MKTADIQAELDEPVSANLIKVVRYNFKKMQTAQQRKQEREEQRQRKGLPVGGTASKKRKKTEADIEAEVEEMLNRFIEE